jgi:FG-GAP repeat
VWTQTQRLSANDANGVDLLGAALALQADTLAVGAPGESSMGASSGAVYIFERSGSMWTQTQKLKASMPGEGWVFGGSVAIDGDRLVVGSPDEGLPNPRTGSAEVFVKRSGKWTSQQRLQPPVLGQTVNFGFATAISGNRIAIGAPRTHEVLSTMSTPPGEVYIYEAEGDGWSQTAKLTATIPTETDEFGVALAFSGTSLAIGASEDVSGDIGIGADPKRTDAVGSGAVYLFALAPSGWSQSAYIKPTNPMAQAWFGFSVAMERDVLVVGSHQESGSGKGVNPGGMNGGAADSGAVYVFR